jgi:hypothetical protein
VLGLSAVQLTHDLPGATMASLSAEGLLTNPLPEGIVVPGNDVERAALGHLHANCGNCHFDGGQPLVDMRLKILQAHTAVEMTGAFATGINQPTTNFDCDCDRIEPGDPAASAIFQRMSIRGMGQMPPISTELVDDDGVEAIASWILQLPP